MKPLKNLVVIEINKIAEKQTAAGLYIPKDKWGENENTAIVKTVGEGCNYEFKEGDKVLINPYAVIDALGDEKLIKASDILAICQ